MKTLILRVAEVLGVFHMFRWWNRNSILVLYVHGVVDHDADSAWKPLRSFLSPDVFAKQLNLIGRHYRWVPLAVAIEMIEGDRPLQPNTVAITFDDGYENNKSVALPILKKHNIVPTFYVPPGFMNSNKPFWFDRFDYVIQQIKKPFSIEMKGETYEFLPGDRENQRVMYERLRNRAKAVFETDAAFLSFFDLQCSLLEETVGLSLASIQATDIFSATLNEGDIHNVSADDTVVIGSHTVDHMRLDTVSAEKCVHELSLSKTVLEKVTGRLCDQFCYPNGNFNSDVAESVMSCGYHSAVTTIHGLNPAGTDRYKLRRIHLPNHADSARLGYLLSGSDFVLGKLWTAVRGKSKQR